MVAALKSTQLSHYLFCSSIWAHGRVETLPADPNDPAKEPLDDYGKNKFASEKFLKNEYRTTGFPATIIMPGQISGPGWTIINQVRNTDIGVFQMISLCIKIINPNYCIVHLQHDYADTTHQ